MTERLAYGRATLASGTKSDEPIVFKASTEMLNRKGYSLRLDGWRLDNFNANPVMLWMHDSWSPPIGRGSAAVQSDHLQFGPVEFDAEDEFAAQLESKVRRGFLNGVSCGFHFQDEDGAPLDWYRMDKEELYGEAFYDLAEISLVSIPADPTALRTRQGLALRRISRELAGLLDEDERPESRIPADELAAAVRAELARLGIDPTQTPGPAPVPAGIDETAAQAVLAAFTLGGPVS